MSWFSGSTVPITELDGKIDEATSESIPNGEIDIATALEITDLIRSRKIPAKQCMRSLKKRLITTYSNPNLIVSTLKLVDLCIKNGGYQFLVEIASKEFIDYLIDYVFKIHYNTKDYKVYSNESKLNVGKFILKLLKEWSFYFQNQVQLNYVDKVYNQLIHQGFEFPELDNDITQLSANFIDSDVPPDWVDSDECMICYSPFTVLLRKHHCRSCGGVFCQTHSSHFIPLVHLGLMEPVRVCDNCYEKVKAKNSGNLKKVQKNSHTDRSLNASDTLDDEDEQLRKAIELSLQDSGVRVGSYNQPPPSPPLPAIPPPSVPKIAPPLNEEEEDEDMKAAIAASLKEFEAQERLYKQPVQQEPTPQVQSPAQPQSDFYSNVSLFDGQGEVPFTQPNFNQQPQQQNYGQPPPQQQPIPAQTTKPVEDLTQAEEESIDLFITLMNQVKNDRLKQTSIIYDSKLSELHNKVIQLKPKLNKSLRSAIERYDHFLELNNKISTITRLYDQFLESKLNQAYSNHYVSDPNQQGNMPPQYTNPSNIPYPVEESRPQALPVTSPGQSYNQRNQYPPQLPVQNNQPLYNQGQAPPSQNQGQNQGQAPYEANPPRQGHNQVPYEAFYPGYPTESYSGKNDEYTAPTTDYKTPSAPDYTAPSAPDFTAPSAPNFNNTGPSYPSYSEPSYPPGDSDEESDAESVASRFPPVEHEESTNLSEVPAPNGPVKRMQSAGTRYPPIETLEARDSEFPSVSQLPTIKPSPSSTSIHRTEPEPLIEL